MVVYFELPAGQKLIPAKARQEACDDRTVIRDGAFP